MKKYKKFAIPTIVFSIFIVIAILLSLYILSLPLSQITNGDCSGFSDYQLTNCIAFYERQGDIDVVQQYAQTAFWMLWTGLFVGATCSFFVFPRISLPYRLKVDILFLGLLTALLIAGLPLALFTKPIINGFLFALSLIIGFLVFELVLVTPTKEVVATEEPASSMQR